MSWLLDTHALLWALTDDARLSPLARQVLADRDAQLLVSAASAWEVAIKVAAGRLRLPIDPARFLDVVTGPLGLETLPIHFDHAIAAASLPAIHRDPFDRMLVAQARAIDATILTSDARIAAYPVKTEW